MTEKIMFWVLGYLVVAFILGVIIGKAIKRANPCRHDWKAQGYGGAGWTAIECTRCGAREVSPE
jgi:hypothetical protein